MAPLPAATAAGAAAPVPAPASQPPPSSMPPPQQQHQQPPPPPFAQQQAAPAPSPGAPMPGGMRLSFDQMAGKTEHHQHHAAPMLYAPPPPQSAAGAPGGNVLGMGELMRKKRGRPRKYAPDGSMALALAPISSASAGGGAAPGQQQHGGFSISSPPSDPNAKRRGRPPGSGKKKQFEALGACSSPSRAQFPAMALCHPGHVSSVKSHQRCARACRFLGHRLHPSHPHRQGRRGKIHRSCSTSNVLLHLGRRLWV